MTASNSSPPDNGSCYHLESVAKPVLALYATLIAVVVLATLAGNGLVLTLVARYKRLRSRSVVPGVSLVVADILWGLCYHFPTLASVASVGWPFERMGCSAFGLLSIEFLVTRWLIMAVICFDRFSTVRFPFSYAKYSKCIIIFLTAVAWILPFLLAFFPVIARFSQETFRPNIPTCLYDCADSDTLCRSYYGLVVTLSFFLGAVLPILLYVWLYKRARRLKWPRIEMGHTSLQRANGASVPQSTARHLEGAAREVQGYTTFILIVVTVIVTALPAYVSQVIRTSSYENWCKIPIEAHFAIQLVFFSSTALDPLVVMRDRDFRHCLKHMFCCKKEETDNVVVQSLQMRRGSVDPLLSSSCRPHRNQHLSTSSSPESDSPPEPHIPCQAASPLPLSSP